ACGGLCRGRGVLPRARDPLFREPFRETPRPPGTEAVRLPPKSPNVNAFAERFVRSIKESCLDRLILIGEPSLRRAVREFVTHYHQERNHQGLGNVLILSVAGPTPNHDRVACRERLGGLLKYYHRPAA